MKKDVYFAPLEGIGNHIYRNAWRRHYGGVSRYYTPFLDLNSVGGIKNRGIADILPEHNAGISLIPQVMTDSAAALSKAAETLAGYGYSEVNLNLGCPVGTVTAKGRGAGLLADREKLRRFLDEAFRSCPLALSVKMRIGCEDPAEGPALLDLMNEFPIKELIVHPRLRREYYSGEIHADLLDLYLRESRNPVCINPGIKTAADYAAAMDRWPHCTGVMIGRGLIAEPELAEKCTAAGPSDVSSAGGPAIDLRRFSAFHEDLLASYRSVLSGDTPVLFKMKELWSYWADTTGMDSRMLKKIKKSRSVDEYQSVLAGFLPR